MWSMTLSLGLRSMRCQLTIIASSSSVLSPNLSARSQTAWVTLSILIGSSKVNRWFCPTTRACSTIVRESATSPLTAHPTWLSISIIFSIEEASKSFDCDRRSTPRMTPCWVVAAMVVDPNLMASIAYSTWKSRPSGEKVLTPRSRKDKMLPKDKVLLSLW